MLEKHSMQDNILGTLLYLVWVVIIMLIIGGVAYLFIAGGILLSDGGTEPIIAYREVSNGKVSLTGSILLPNSCSQLFLDNNEINGEQLLEFTVDKPYVCEGGDVDKSVSETFFIQFDGDEHTPIKVKINGDNRDIIVK